MSNSLYSELSVQLTKDISKIEKQQQGIYFSSKNTIHQAIHTIRPFLRENMRILEPSCGTCEFITHLDNMETVSTGNTIDCVEYNQSIYNEIKSLNFQRNTVNIHHSDFLTYTSSEPYDLIIGNPPYFVIPKKDVDVSYWSYFTGRPNIFNIFIAKSLSMLAENGILCFVLPKSFLNCIYYDNTRSHIYNNYNIVAIEPCNDAKFIDTTQETIIFTIQKNAPKNNSRFTIAKNGFTIFHDPTKIEQLHDMYKESTTLDQMGFKVGVGTVVWNQVKSELTHDKTKTMLIYSSNVEDNKIVVKDFKNDSKKQYIDRDGKNDMCLIVNRGYGNGEYKFQYAIVNQTQPYLLENHIICITLKPTQTKLSKAKLLAQYQKITKSFDNEKTRQFINMYFSNNAINTTELQHILPIY